MQRRGAASANNLSVRVGNGTEDCSQRSATILHSPSILSTSTYLHSSQPHQLPVRSLCINLDCLFAPSTKIPVPSLLSTFKLWPQLVTNMVAEDRDCCCCCWFDAIRGDGHCIYVAGKSQQLHEPEWEREKGRARKTMRHLVPFNGQLRITSSPSHTSFIIFCLDVAPRSLIYCLHNLQMTTVVVNAGQDIPEYMQIKIATDITH